MSDFFDINISWVYFWLLSFRWTHQYFNVNSSNNLFKVICQGHYFISVTSLSDKVIWSYFLCRIYGTCLFLNFDKHLEKYVIGTIEHKINAVKFSVYQYKFTGIWINIDKYNSVFENAERFSWIVYYLP